MIAVWLRFLSSCLPGLFVTTGSVTAAGTLLLASQAFALSPVLPGPRGMLGVLAGYCPTALGVALPVGLLVGVLTASRSWWEAGELLGLACCGKRPRTLAWPVFALGLCLAGLQAGLSHGLEPLGRSDASARLHAASSDLRLRPEQPAQLGPVLVHARAVEGRAFRDVFIASPGVVAAAERGRLASGERLLLEGGTAVSDDPELEWSLEFDSAELSLAQGGRRIELAERSTASLRDLVARMEARGSTAHAERLALFKRSLVPLGLPLLGLLALPLGGRGWSPGSTTLVAAVGWWALMRIGDQAVAELGPLMAGLLPHLGLMLALVWSWATWRRS